MPKIKFSQPGREVEYKLPLQFDGVRIFSSEVSDGSMNRDNIKKNLPKFLHKNHISSTIAYCEQVHENNIRIISKKGFYRNCDGLVTGEEIGLIVKSADCIPLLFFSREQGIRGALHVGWRSLVLGIVTKSLKSILKETALSPTELSFFIGPHIRVQNYQVQKEAITQITKNRYSPFLEKKDDKVYFNLTRAIQSELAQIGIKEENIFDSKIDTFRDKNFFSYRRGDRDKLFVTLISKWPKDK